MLKWLSFGIEADGRDYRVVPSARIFLDAGFTFVVIAAIAAIWMVSRTADAERDLTNAFEIRRQATALLGELGDAETGQRGFLLTGDRAYLEPYERAVRGVPADLSRLRQSTTDPAEEARLARVGSLIDAKLQELKQTIALAERGQLAPALAIVKSDRGRMLMGAIRAELASFSQSTLESLTARQALVSQMRRWVLAVICFSLVSALALAALLARSTVRALHGLRLRTAQLESEVERRREAEATLRQAQKMEAVGQLAGGIAHDFNNLLTIIIGNLDTLRRRLAAAPETFDGAALSQPLEFAMQGARAAAQLTQRLLAFSRRQPLQPARLDLNKVVAGMSEILQRTLGQSIAIETILAGGLWTAFADANQLENALLNLCVNARDAMPDGGRLTIETANTYLDEAYTQQFDDITPGQYVQLSVSDTGKGISPEFIERVFEPFFTTKTGSEGTGLGLSMVHGFVRQSGGHIRIYSEPGEGTTVKIYLPRLLESHLAHSAPAAKAVATVATPRGRGETILVVEDNDGVRTYAVTSLKELGYAVLEACSGREGLDMLKSSPSTALIFTDIVLPGINGRQFADAARALKGDIPVLFTTGYSRNAIIHHGRLDAGVHLLNKPYTQSDLGRKVRELLDTRAGSVGVY